MRENRMCEKNTGKEEHLQQYEMIEVRCDVYVRKETRCDWDKYLSMWKMRQVEKILDKKKKRACKIK